MKLLLTIMLTFSSLFALEEYCEKSGCIAKIKRLYLNSNGVVYVDTTQDEKLANCTPVGGKYLTLSSTAPKEFYSTLLSSYMTNEKVYFRVIEGSNKCQISYIVLDRDY